MNNATTTTATTTPVCDLTPCDPGYFTGKWDSRGICEIIPAVTAHLPHARYTYWDGGAYLIGIMPVLPGQTPEQACAKYASREGFRAWIVELFDDPPKR